VYKKIQPLIKKVSGLISENNGADGLHKKERRI
jgi:hypothetical protein